MLRNKIEKKNQLKKDKKKTQVNLVNLLNLNHKTEIIQ
jgi:hypothetical protein